MEEECGRGLPACLPVFADLGRPFSTVTDAYCLLAVYMVLSANPASFGLPADLRGAVVSGGGCGGPLQRPERNRDKKQKKAAAVQDLVRSVSVSVCVHTHCVAKLGPFDMLYAFEFITETKLL